MSTAVRKKTGNNEKNCGRNTRPEQRRREERVKQKEEKISRGTDSDNGEMNVYACEFRADHFWRSFFWFICFLIIVATHAWESNHRLNGMMWRYYYYFWYCCYYYHYECRYSANNDVRCNYSPTSWRLFPVVTTVRDRLHSIHLPYTLPQSPKRSWSIHRTRVYPGNRVAVRPELTYRKRYF